MNGVYLVFRISIFMERGSRQTLGLNVPTLRILDAEQSPEAATAAEAEHPRLWRGHLLRSSAQREPSKTGDPGDVLLSSPPPPHYTLHRDCVLAFI